MCVRRRERLRLMISYLLVHQTIIAPSRSGVAARKRVVVIAPPVAPSITILLLESVNIRKPEMIEKIVQREGASLHLKKLSPPSTAQPTGQVTNLTELPVTARFQKSLYECQCDDRLGLRSSREEGLARTDLPPQPTLFPASFS